MLMVTFVVLREFQSPQYLSAWTQKGKKARRDPHQFVHPHIQCTASYPFYFQ